MMQLFVAVHRKHVMGENHSKAIVVGNLAVFQMVPKISLWAAHRYIVERIEGIAV